MSKLAHSMRTRTGQAPGLMSPGGIGNGAAGPCGGLPPAAPHSWGAACPTGTCTSESLAASLNRAFAGEKYGCRELPYWILGTATAGGVVTIAQNSLVTICPTRVMFVEGDGGATPADAIMSVFEIQNQNQIVGDPIPPFIFACPPPPPTPHPLPPP